MWKPVGRIDIVDLDKEFYSVRFYSEDDYDTILDKGPWFIGEKPRPSEKPQITNIFQHLRTNPKIFVHPKLKKNQHISLMAKRPK